MKARRRGKSGKKPSPVSVGESIRIIRQLQDMSQGQLSRLTGISQTTISAIEHDRVKLGAARAKRMGRALKCHPGVFLFPSWELTQDEVASSPSQKRR